MRSCCFACLLGVQCKRRSVCLSCPSRWQRHFGLDWIGCLRCVRTSDPTPTNRDRHSHPSASPAGQPDLLALTDTVSAASTSYHFGTNERYTRQRGFGGARLIDASVAAPSVANISRSRNKERRDVWPSSSSGSPESPTPIEPLLPFAWPRKKKKPAAATAATKKAEDDGWVQVQVLQGGWNWNGCDAMATPCLPACTAGWAGYGCVITDQSVCGHVQREQVSEKGWSSKAQGMDARGKQGVQPKFSLS